MHLLQVHLPPISNPNVSQNLPNKICKYFKFPQLARKVFDVDLNLNLQTHLVAIDTIIHLSNV